MAVYSGPMQFVSMMNWQPCRQFPSQPSLASMPIHNFRVDLRKLLVFSVDPIGCKEIDDALHCRVLSNGNFEIGVHIADVTHFVYPESSIDNEALTTGKSIKMIDPDVAHMCSIHPELDKLTFSVIWEITQDAKIVSFKYVKAVIRSRVALSYNEAQEIIDNNFSKDPLRMSLRILNTLSKCFRRKRIERGAIIQQKKHEKEDSKIMVEEFMILANISVAETIYKHFPQFSLLRRLPNSGTSNVKFKSMDKVEYLISRDINLKEDLYHYGIGKYLYTHFTSPIRRYVDVHVHRLLAASLGITKVPNIFINRSNLLNDMINKLNCHTTQVALKRRNLGWEYSEDATDISKSVNLDDSVGDLCNLIKSL